MKVNAKSRPGKVLAKIGDQVVTTGDLQSRLDQQSPFARSRYKDPEKMADFVDNQIKFEVLAAEAMARGYHEQPEAMDAVKKIIVQRLSREEYDGSVKMTDISEDEARSYYDANKADYNKPEMIRASVIKMPFGVDKTASSKAAEAVQKSAADPARLDDRNHFKALVAKHSKDTESRKLGGDLRYLEHETIKEKFGPVALEALLKAEKINDVTTLVEGADAFYVFKRTGKRKPIIRDFNAVRSQIRNKLYRERKTQRFDAWVEGLKDKYKVTIDKQAIAELNATGGPGGPGGPGPSPDPHGHQKGSQ